MVILALILPIVFAQPATQVPVVELCPKSAATSDKAEFKRLGELPSAEAFKAVWRPSVCGAPVVHARDRMGRAPRSRR